MDHDDVVKHRKQRSDFCGEHELLGRPARPKQVNKASRETSSNSREECLELLQPLAQATAGRMTPLARLKPAWEPRPKSRPNRSAAIALLNINHLRTVVLFSAVAMEKLIFPR